METIATHESSTFHREAVINCSDISKASIQCQLSTQLAQQQDVHSAMKYFLRQGLETRGHHDYDGNLQQLPQTWADDEVFSAWPKQGQFMSHDHINELITVVGHDVLRKVLARVKSEDPAWYAVIADETSDVSWNEHLKVLLR